MTGQILLVYHLNCHHRCLKINDHQDMVDVVVVVREVMRAHSMADMEASVVVEIDMWIDVAIEDLGVMILVASIGAEVTEVEAEIENMLMRDMVVVVEIEMNTRVHQINIEADHHPSKLAMQEEFPNKDQIVDFRWIIGG
jgi:hypothetical protein